MCQFCNKHFHIKSEPWQKMFNFRALNFLIVLLGLILTLGETGIAQQRNRMLLRPFQQPAAKIGVPPMMCTHDSLLIYLDCRMCACPRPNRLAKCFKKSCDLRTKDTGQCPAAMLRLDDWKSCSVTHVPGCKVDLDCPDNQLCCFDFCGSPKCVQPVPLDATTGTVVHGGRGYA